MKARWSLCLVLICMLYFGLNGQALAIDVGRYKVLELVFRAKTTLGNPFDTYVLKLEVMDPLGNRLIIDGFFDGDGNGSQEGMIWKARICPYMIGTWSWKTVPGDSFNMDLVGLSGEFRCVESGDIGGVIARGQHFRFQDGDYVYLVGNFLDKTVQYSHIFMSEMILDAQRNAVIGRNRDFHDSNKMNVYFANKGDYAGLAVTPWLGTASSNDKKRMDLAKWKLYDRYIRHFKDNNMLAEMWFFADDSNFGSLSHTDKKRLFRYVMARTSAFSHIMYVIALEWEEGWTRSSVTQSGNFIQLHNPWRRLLSVHSTGTSWSFAGKSWASFIASQPGNRSDRKKVNSVAIAVRKNEIIPHISEEFGILGGDSDTKLRNNLWANFCGGAAGSGTGSDLKAFQRFLSQSRVPFQRMVAANHLVGGGGSSRFLLAEVGHHYAVYSSGGAFKLNVSGVGLVGRWFNPRNPAGSLGSPFGVFTGEQTFTPPTDVTQDWVLWASDCSNLLSGVTHPSAGAILTQEVITQNPDTTPPSSTGDASADVNSGNSLYNINGIVGQFLNKNWMKMLMILLLFPFVVCLCVFLVFGYRHVKRGGRRR